MLRSITRKLAITTRIAGLLAATAVAGALLSAPALAADAKPKKDFKLAWSIYVGWMPWQYAAENGIVKKWADKYGIKIEVVQFNDYVESINQYTAGAYDAVTVTNMDALSIPAAGGVDTTALIVGDYSNGNDGIVLKGNKTKLTDIKGQKVNLVELSVSHYLLARGLETAGMSERDVTVVNTSDADIVAAWSTPDVTAAVTWNPMLSEVKDKKDGHEVFDSSKIPGEIMDLAVVNTDTLNANPAFGKALVGIWYETLTLMTGDSPAAKAARTAMGKASGTDLAGFDAQLKTTKMFYTPAEALTFTRNGEAKTYMNRVRNFLWAHGLLGNDAKSADVIGIQFPDGSILGDKANVKLRFSDTYIVQAADGKL